MIGQNLHRVFQMDSDIFLPALFVKTHAGFRIAVEDFNLLGRGAGGKIEHGSSINPPWGEQGFLTRKIFGIDTGSEGDLLRLNKVEGFILTHSYLNFHCFLILFGLAQRR